MTWNDEARKKLSESHGVEERRTPPIFEQYTSPLTRSNDGRLVVLRESNTKGWIVVDETDDHVETFTLKREIADAFVAGYDYRERITR